MCNSPCTEPLSPSVQTKGRNAKGDHIKQSMKKRHTSVHLLFHSCMIISKSLCLVVNVTEEKYRQQPERDGTSKKQHC
jgi:hypothetical protein